MFSTDVARRAAEALRLRADPTVFFTSALLILAFVVFGVAFTDTATQVTATIQSGVTSVFGWVYHVTVTASLLFCLVLCCGPFGRMRLGCDSERPEFSGLSWFAMLFSAGMGIGILFWSVAEPATHYLKPPQPTATPDEAALQAMNITLLHWGLHGWAVFAVAGLGVAFAAYRQGQPLTFRSVLYPALGDHTDGWAGKAVDIFAVIGTLFGVATSLAFGAQQINAGLEHLLGVEQTLITQVALIGGITAIATASVVSGLDRGIKLLSKSALLLAAPLLVYVLVAGPTWVGLWSVVKYGVSYTSALASHGLVSTFGEPMAWQADWTLFYWGWWIAWAPFIGIFYARISKGRTIREFVLGTLLLPTAVTCGWFCVFGGMGLQRVMEGDTALASAVTDNFSIAIFIFFQEFPGAIALSIVSLLVIVVFFVTSSDSASLVVDYIAAGGDKDPPKRQRVFWATLEGMVAAVLLVGGGMGPIRAFQVLTGLPLAFVLLWICGSVGWSVIRDHRDG